MNPESHWLYYLRGAQAVGLIAAFLVALALIHVALILAGFRYLAGVELNPRSFGVWIGALVLVGLTTRIAWWTFARRRRSTEREE
ncbi:MULTISPECIES: hypothetical protein [unclassified Thioalkalivibrio]|uniref:hypothetical protein n=1 Tax=unclassified Thioalkalivibrio TaxID=2621013 RepID=UPI00035F229D|nr:MULTISPECIES: hypothetical protein [unclassified Thioalkalivibrio]